MKGDLVVLNQDRHSVPRGYTEIYITPPGLFQNPFRIGRLPKGILDQLNTISTEARTDKEKHIVSETAELQGIGNEETAVTLHLLYLRHCCRTNTNIGQGIQQLAVRLNKGQNLALIGRSVTTPWRSSEQSHPPCHGINIANAIRGYAQK